MYNLEKTSQVLDELSGLHIMGQENAGELYVARETERMVQGTDHSVAPERSLGVGGSSVRLFICVF